MINQNKLRHVVIFKFKDSSAESGIQETINSFLGLKNKVPGLTDIEWGNNISPENHHQDFTHCFILTFSSMEALAAYQENPDHLAFQKILRPHMEKVFVVDYFASN